MENSPVSSSPQPDLKDLQAQCENLQQIVSSLLLVLIVVSATLSIYLLRQWRFVKGEVEGLTPQAVQMITEHTNSYAMTQDFVRKVAEYGRTHPDFGPIMDKYRLKESLPKPGTSSVTSSLPATATNEK